MSKFPITIMEYKIKYIKKDKTKDFCITRSYSALDAIKDFTSKKKNKNFIIKDIVKI